MHVIQQIDLPAEEDAEGVAWGDLVATTDTMDEDDFRRLHAAVQSDVQPATQADMQKSRQT